MWNILEWLDQHREEVMDFKHFHNFKKESDLQAFYKLLQKKLPAERVYQWKDSEVPSLDRVREDKAQILLAFENTLDKNNFAIKSKKLIRSRWPKTRSVAKLWTIMEEEYKQRSLGWCSQYKYKLTVFQWILSKFTTWEYMSKSLEQVTKEEKVHDILQKWLAYSQTGRFGVNIVIADFAVRNYKNFARDIPTLNCKPHKTTNSCD
ncbi:hypothetical protein Ciccas_014623 [Cichlidogyrus casuarinus]|uniref:Uncharacterized protein n=1 Tax=Cichlidogyrus casuarinus TaxID=1844966 RepID=A0ABD2PKH1_9PLAT